MRLQLLSSSFLPFAPSPPWRILSYRNASVLLTGGECQFAFRSRIAQSSSHLYHALLCSREGSKQMISRIVTSVTDPHTINNPIGFGEGGGMSNDATIPTDSSPIAQFYCDATEGSSVRSFSMEIRHYKEPVTPQSPDLFSPDTKTLRSIMYVVVRCVPKVHAHVNCVTNSTTLVSFAVHWEFRLETRIGFKVPYHSQHLRKTITSNFPLSHNHVA
jgi:hypothetical protein